jgi:hypothetical protein
MTGLGNETPVIKSVFRRMQVPQLLNVAVSVIIVPDFLDVIEIFSENDFKSAIKMVGLPFLEQLKFMLGLDWNGFADFGLLHFCFDLSYRDVFYIV